MRSVFILGFLIFISVTAASAQLPSDVNRPEYVRALNKERALKDVEMRTSEKSPIVVEEKTSFSNLKYFKPKTGFVKEATFERYDQAMHFFMKTTTDRLPEYSLYGRLSFRHKGKVFSLNVYQNIELVKKPGFEKHLFVPFNDKTNGKETYGGGRFLDLMETGEDKLLIDFNKAYNPYCAYNHKYSCPIPPESNNLEISIKAGEKKWHK